ncbi:MAG: MFS transporter [Flavobacteriales bacterium]|nr:MFS transporter [Flavobacteriales bacterium]
MEVGRSVLIRIIIAQFFCTSMWFASNGVMDELTVQFNLSETALAWSSSSVQLGFIIGSLCFAIFGLADRYSPSKLFFVSSVCAAICNVLIVLELSSFSFLFLSRMGTGFFLAGIYPVGMKIASDYYQKTLHKSLGFLVGALVLGTSLPHGLKAMDLSFPWQGIISTTSLLALIGGALILTLKDGPFRKVASAFQWSGAFQIFKNKEFKAAAFGYIGHMWELYAFWVFIPVILGLYLELNPNEEINLSFWSFAIIAIGSIACVLSGYFSKLKGILFTAELSLKLSLLCCLLIPVVIYAPLPVFLLFLLFWAMVAIADSPLFSTLIAQKAPENLKGTALTIVSCLGFSGTIISIQLIASLNAHFQNPIIFLALALGPIGGIYFLIKSRKVKFH